MKDKSFEYARVDENNQTAQTNDIHASDGLETAQSLELVIAQIEMALKESDHSVLELIGAITSMARCVEKIDGKLKMLRQFKDTTTVADDIELNCKQAEADMQQAVTSLQFYDRLLQRFMHIDENLHAVNAVIKAPDQQHPALWQSLHKKLSSVYSLEQEQALLNGSTVQSITNKVDTKTEKSFGNIEFF